MSSVIRWSALIAACVVVGLGCVANDGSVGGSPDSISSSDHAVDKSFRVHLRTSERGLFLAAEGGGGGVVSANRVRAGSWETFTVIVADGSGLVDGARVFLQTADGDHYLMA